MPRWLLSVEWVAVRQWLLVIAVWVFVGTLAMRERRLHLENQNRRRF